MFEAMETHVKACGNELLNTPSEAVNQQLQFCIDTDTHTRIHMHTRTVHANEWEAMRCDARYHSHNGTWVSWKMLVRFFDGFLFFSARDRRVKRFPSPAPLPSDYSCNFSYSCSWELHLFTILMPLTWAIFTLRSFQFQTFSYFHFSA